MKELITARDIKERALRGELCLNIGRQTLVTPSARDAARELGVKLVLAHREAAPGQAPIQAAPAKEAEQLIKGIAGQVCRQAGGSPPDAQLVALVVKEVLAQLGAGSILPEPAVERDAGGLRLVKGGTVVCQPFDTGKPGDRVALKDLLPIKESPRMAAGFMSMEKSSFDWELRYDEYDYIMEGTLEITVDGKTYRGEAGDVFYIPSGSKIIFGAPDKVKFFYVTYPANWQEV